MYEAHDALLCIADGTFIHTEDRRRLTPEHRFKSAEEMAELFADLPEAIENTVEIAQRCAFRPEEAQADPAAVRAGIRPRRRRTNCARRRMRD